MTLTVSQWLIMYLNVHKICLPMVVEKTYIYIRILQEKHDGHPTFLQVSSLCVFSVQYYYTIYIGPKRAFHCRTRFPLITLATYSSLFYLDLYFIVLEIGIRNQQGSSDCYGCSFTISVLHMSHISYFKILATFSSYCNKPHFALVLTTSAFHNPGNWCQKPKLH